MELHNEKDKTSACEKENKRYLAFLSAFYASSNADTEEREKFRQSLLPRDSRERISENHEWNFDLLKQLKSRQKGG